MLLSGVFDEKMTLNTVNIVNPSNVCWLHFVMLLPEFCDDVF